MKARFGEAKKKKKNTKILLTQNFSPTMGHGHMTGGVQDASNISDWWPYHPTPQIHITFFLVRLLWVFVTQIPCASCSDKWCPRKLALNIHENTSDTTLHSSHILSSWWNISLSLNSNTAYRSKQENLLIAVPESSGLEVTSNVCIVSNSHHKPCDVLFLFFYFLFIKSGSQICCSRIARAHTELWFQ